MSTQILQIPIFIFEFTSDLEFIEWFEINQNCNIFSLNLTLQKGYQKSNILRPANNLYRLEKYPNWAISTKISSIFKISPPYVNISFFQNSANMAALSCSPSIKRTITNSFFFLMLVTRGWQDSAANLLNVRGQNSGGDAGSLWKEVAGVMQRVCIHIPTILAILPHKSLSMLGRFLIYQNLPKDVEENERSTYLPASHPCHPITTTTQCLILIILILIWKMSN